MSGTLEVVVLGLGSNLGDRGAYLSQAVRELDKEMNLLACSSVYESQPVGYLEQGPFLNLVLLATSGIGPEQALLIAMAIEDRAGRRRDFRWGPRSLDVDLLLWGERVIDRENLEIPHPRWKERSFVLAPLAEVAPQLRDPASGATVLEIWTERGSELEPAEIWAPPFELPSRRGRV